MPLVVFLQALLHGVVGGFLKVAAHRGDDAIALGVGIAAVAADHFRTGHLGDVRRDQFGALHMVGGGDGLAHR
ncbi:hypothetical protein D9M71_48910 [compost metagenome]